jgi:hypothetical protein
VVEERAVVTDQGRVALVEELVECGEAEGT